MDIFTLSSPHASPAKSPPFSAAPLAGKHRLSPSSFFASCGAPSHVSFSLRPVHQPEPEPEPEADPTASTSSSTSRPLRRPHTIRESVPSSSTGTTTTTASAANRVPKNPLKSFISPSRVASYQPAASRSLSNKLWLSSRLSPPPPPPSPPPEIQEIEAKTVEESDPPEKSSSACDAPPSIDYRQLGKIFVGNLPSWIKKHEVTEFFRQFGPIGNVILIKGHNETERNAGFGFVIYGGPAAARSAMKAVEFDGVEFHGRVLTVKLDDGKRQKSRAEERARYVEGCTGEGREYRSEWHKEREGSRNGFRSVLEAEPENWQAVVSAFERIKKV